MYIYFFYFQSVSIIKPPFQTRTDISGRLSKCFDHKATFPDTHSKIAPDRHIYA